MKVIKQFNLMIYPIIEPMMFLNTRCITGFLLYTIKRNIISDEINVVFFELKEFCYERV
jgi:hypothetical protein